MIKLEKNEVLHIKSGTTYTVLANATDCTNDMGDRKVVIYTNGHSVFVREYTEFYENFKPL